MLSEQTLAAIAILKDISVGIADRANQCNLEEATLSDLLHRLERGGLIRLKERSLPATLSAYQLARPYSEISLLDILGTTGEHLNCNKPLDEKLYSRYQIAAQRLGIINQMTRLYLSNIHLSDL